MAYRKILLEDDPVLRKKSKEVTVFDANTIELFKDLEETMHKAEGAGLSAVQVGILKRMFVISDHNETYYVANPTILSETGHNRYTLEGCLSLPEKCGIVNRPAEIETRFQDQNGKWVEHTFKDWLCKAFCHEYDHLEGILYPDRAKRMFNNYDEYLAYRKSKDAKKNKNKEQK